MDKDESILAAISEYDLEDFSDAEMIDLEEGELVDQKGTIGLKHNTCGSDCQGSQRKQNRRRAKNKKTRRKRRGSHSNITDIHRFVIDTCKFLKEKKSYMVYTAVGCLGISALSSLLNEVDAIQSCGGQMTADGGRHRTGGGILWNILKEKEPLAYKEIMKKAKEFEGNFRRPEKNRDASSLRKLDAAPNASQTLPPNQTEHPIPNGKCRFIHDRLRVPVPYDDLHVDDGHDDTSLTELAVSSSTSPT